MSASENKQLVREFVEQAQSLGNLDAIESYLAPEFVNHSVLPGLPPTRDGVRQLFSMFWSAFPDLHATIHDQVAEGDKVVTRKTLSGTHRGDFFGIPATGKAVHLDVIDILRVVDGRITDHWNVVDQLGLLQQLGAVPMPPPPVSPPASA